MSSSYTQFKPTRQPQLIPKDASLVHNVKAARVYVFGNSDVYEDEISSDSEDVELSAVKSRKIRSSHSAKSEDQLLFDRLITDKDTLQSIAVQYACTVAELKRINNLIGDQEFFGRRVIKVPVKRHGILSELLEHENLPKQVAPTLPLCPSPSNELEPSFAEEYGYSRRECAELDSHSNGIHHNHLSKQGRETEAFLENVDRNLQRIQQSTSFESKSVDEVISLLNHKDLFPPPTRRHPYLNGADCGVRWWVLLGGFFTGVIVIVIIAAVYFSSPGTAGST